MIEISTWFLLSMLHECCVRSKHSMTAKIQIDKMTIVRCKMIILRGMFWGAHVNPKCDVIT